MSNIGNATNQPATPVNFNVDNLQLNQVGEGGKMSTFGGLKVETRDNDYKPSTMQKLKTAATAAKDFVMDKVNTALSKFAKAEPTPTPTTSTPANPRDLELITYPDQSLSAQDIKDAVINKNAAVWQHLASSGDNYQNNTINTFLRNDVSGSREVKNLASSSYNRFEATKALIEPMKDTLMTLATAGENGGQIRASNATAEQSTMVMEAAREILTLLLADENTIGSLRHNWSEESRNCLSEIADKILEMPGSDKAKEIIVNNLYANTIALRTTNGDMVKYDWLDPNDLQSANPNPNQELRNGITTVTNTLQSLFNGVEPNLKQSNAYQAEYGALLAEFQPQLDQLYTEFGKPQIG